MAVNILKTTLTVNGYSKNSPTKEIVVTLDGSILISEINDYLPNNKNRYNDEVGGIPSGSTATLLTSDTMIVAVFNAEASAEGTWKVISELPFMA